MRKSDGWEGRYNETAIFAKENGVSMVLVNSNEAKRDNHDSMDAMKAHAKENNYGMPYLLDANHQLADAFGALKTPHVYLFDGGMNLVYRGSIDDNVSDADAVSERYVQDAITAVANGKPVGVWPRPKPSAAPSSAFRSNQSGRLPCFLRGRVSTLFWSISNARISLARVLCGRITSST